MTNEASVSLWRGPSGIPIPATLGSAEQIVPLAQGLKESEKDRVINALNNGFYEMGAEFVWRRAMSRIRLAMANLGPDFLAEMTGRDELVYASVENHITDHDTIRLAEALGVVSSTGAMRLRHAYEVVVHFSAGKADDEEMPAIDAAQIIKTCVQYALGEETIGVAVDFSRFRNRLLSETLSAGDSQVEQFMAQPPFFLSTALRVLLAAIRRDSGARQQHALSNLNVLLPLMWSSLPETDRWSLGELYADSSTAGATEVILDLKRTLLRVKGFDYVPESLRSTTFRKTANAVLEAHFGFNNFYTEGPVVQQLASLGTVIPKAAVADCITAYLCVYLGNRYGFSFDAAPVALQELRSIPSDYWAYYFGEVLKHDEPILLKLDHEQPRARFVELLNAIAVPEAAYAKEIEDLIKAAKSSKPDVVRDIARRLLAKYKPTNT
jgi:hypothetical protein